MIDRSLKNPVFFSLLILITYFIGIWHVSIPLTGDQKVYLSIALEMFEKKEWVIPTLFDEPNFLKPPFQYWATMLGWFTFGIGMLGALLPSLLALVGSAFFTYEIGKKLKLSSPPLAALLFAGTIGTMTYGSTAQMEIWIVLFFLAAWWAVLNLNLTLAYVLVGVMAWVKGPLYPALWTGCYLAWNFNSIKTKRFWFSLLLGTLIGLSWYLLAASTHREEMIKQFFYTENLGKMNTHQGTVFALWGEFLFSLFPWIGLLILGCFQQTTRDKWKTNKKFYLSYCMIPMIFFSVFPYRVNSYFFLFTPVFAMLASEIDLQFARRFKAIGLGIYLVFFSLLTSILIRLIQGDWIEWWIGLFAALSFLTFALGFLKAKWSHVSISSLVIVNLIRLSGTQIGERDVNGLKEFVQNHPAPFAYYLDTRDIWHEYGLISAVLAQPVQRIYEKNKLDIFLAHGGSVIFQEDQQMELQKNLRCVEWQRLKRRTKFPIQRFLNQGIHWGDPELMRNYHICSSTQ